MPSSTRTRFWLWMVEASVSTPVVRWGLRSLTVETGIERVADVDRRQEARGLLDEAHQRAFDQERELSGSGGRLDQHLIAVREQVGMAVATAVLAVVVDRVVVAGGRLEGQELRLRHGARGDVEGLAEREVLEIAGGREAVGGGVERLGHGAASVGRPVIRPARRAQSGAGTA